MPESPRLLSGHYGVDLPDRVAAASAAATKIAEDLGKFTGRARELLEGRLRLETERLEAAERQLAQTDRELADLEIAATDTRWMVGAMRDFGKVWQYMTPENRGRLLRALVAEVRVDESGEAVEVELINLARAIDGKEAA